MIFSLRLLNLTLFCSCSFILSMIPSVLTAQPSSQGKGKGVSNVLFSPGLSIEKPRGHFDLFFVGSPEVGYSMINYAPRKQLTIQHFNKDLQIDTTVSISLIDFPKDLQIVGFERLGKKYYWFFCTWDKIEKIERLFAQEFDMKHISLIGGIREIAATSKISGDEGFKAVWNHTIADKMKWQLHLSLDSSKLLVQYRRKSEVTQQNEYIGMRLFDSDLNKLFEQEVKMPYEEVNIGYDKYVIDKENNVYALVKLYKDKVREGMDYRMLILKWSKDSPEAQQIVIDIGPKFVNDANLTKDKNGNLIVVGCYSNKPKGEGADGVFIQRLESSGELTNIKKGIYDFPPSVLSGFASSRKLRTGDVKGEANSMEIRDVVMADDGSVQIITEAHVVEIKYVVGETVTKYQDVIVVSIGSGGELKWVTRVQKDQTSLMGSNGISMKRIAYNGETYLFFMDDHANLEIKPGKAPKRYDGDKACLMLVKLDKDGNQSKAIVAELPQHLRRYYLSMSQQVAPDKWLLYGADYKQKELAYLIFK